MLYFYIIFILKSLLTTDDPAGPVTDQAGSFVKYHFVFIFGLAIETQSYSTVDQASYGLKVVYWTAHIEAVKFDQNSCIWICQDAMKCMKCMCIRKYDKYR